MDAMTTGPLLASVRRHRTALTLLAIALLLWLPDAALAHEDQVLRLGSFWGGFLHPVLGLDHFLAMLSVGIVSAQIGGRAIWTVPSVFVGTMAVGFFIGRTEWDVMTAIEWGIVASVVILGAIIATGARIPIGWIYAAVGLFALFHGFAHGAETPSVANPPVYVAGFLIGTAAIHLLGVLIGEIAKRYRPGPAVLRVGGAAVSVLGVLFIVGVL